MIKAGKCLCHKCGRVSDFAYYSTGIDQYGVILRKGIRNKYAIEPYSPKGTVPDGVVMELSSVEKRRDSIDCLKIKVTYQGVTQEKTFHRYCPLCDGNTLLSYEYGRLPTYVITVAGKIGAGKSSWIYAMSFQDNLTAVNAAGYPYIIHSVKPELSDQDKKATPPGDTGLTRLLIIKTRDKKPKPIAAVLLRDVSGEDLEGEKSEEYYRLLFGDGEENKGSGALVFIDNDCNAPSDVTNKLVEMFYNNRAFEGIHVAYVMCCADVMMNEARETKAMYNNEGRTAVFQEKNMFPVCTRGSDYEKDKLVQRIALENMVVNNYRRAIMDTINDGGAVSKGFFVKICKPDINDTQKSIHDNPINVMDPLLWTLNRLGIFPLEKAEGGKK